MVKADEMVTENKMEHNAAQFREDARRFGNSMKEYGSHKMDEFQRKAADYYDQARDSSRDAVHDMRAKWNQMEHQVADYVREKPGTSMAIAAGIGFMAAMMMRR